MKKPICFFEVLKRVKNGINWHTTKFHFSWVKCHTGRGGRGWYSKRPYFDPFLKTFPLSFIVFGLEDLELCRSLTPTQEVILKRSFIEEKLGVGVLSDITKEGEDVICFAGTLCLTPQPPVGIALPLCHFASPFDSFKSILKHYSHDTSNMHVYAEWKGTAASTTTLCVGSDQSRRKEQKN